jgi:hypothetical protein
MKTINTFHYDHWAPKPVTELEVGDLISHGGKVATVAARPYTEGGKTHIPGEPYDSGPIKLLVGEFADGMEHIMMAMEFVGSELAEFDDGTALITDLEAGHSLVYSPRLPLAELEAFCAEHIERYRAFYDANEVAIESHQTVAIEPWWPQAQQ